MADGIFEPYQELEQRWAEFTGSEFAVSCNSGTSALHLALLALGVGPGDEVIVPDFTMAACAFAVSYTGATPVFGDVSLTSYGLRVSEVQRLITPKTKAIMVVHVYGRVNDLQPFKQFGLPIVEDACEAQGVIYKSAADLTCYSFYKNKIISAEEGGMVTTNYLSHANTMRQLKNMAFTPAHDYTHSRVGYNYRMPNSQAALAIASLDHYPENFMKRKRIESWYDSLLPHPQTPRDAVWFYDALGHVVLQDRGMRHAFKPLSSLPMYGGKGLPNATGLSTSLVLYPAHPSLTRRNVEELCQDVRKIEYARAGRSAAPSLMEI